MIVANECMGAVKMPAIHVRRRSWWAVQCTAAETCAAAHAAVQIASLGYMRELVMISVIVIGVAAVMEIPRHSRVMVP